MENNLSFIDIRIKELRNHYLFKILLSLIIPFIILFSLTTIYLLPLNFNVTYKEWIFSSLSIIYMKGSRQTIINICLILIDILIIIIIFLFTLYFSNKKYHKLYLKILYDELSLNEFYIYDKNNYVEEDAFDKLYEHCPYSLDFKEYIFSLKKDESFLSFYQAKIKNEKYKNLSIIIFDNKKKKKDFILFSSAINCPMKTYNNQEIFKDTYISRKYISDIYVYSSYRKKTSQICNKELLDEFDSLQRIIKSKIIITSINKYIFLVIPGWKLNFCEPLIFSNKKQFIDNKIQSIDQIYASLNHINQILEKYCNK